MAGWESQILSRDFRARACPSDLPDRARGGARGAWGDARALARARARRGRLLIEGAAAQWV